MINHQAKFYRLPKQAWEGFLVPNLSSRGTLNFGAVVIPQHGRVIHTWGWPRVLTAARHDSFVEFDHTIKILSSRGVPTTVGMTWRPLEIEHLAKLWRLPRPRQYYSGARNDRLK